MLERIQTLSKKTCRLAVALAVLACIAPASTGAEPGPMDEKAAEVLKSMSDYLAGADTVSFHVKNFFDQVRESGIKIKSAREARLHLQRPDKLYIESIAEDGTARTVWFDGKEITVWLRHKNEVKTLEFEGTVDELLDVLSDKYQLNLPVADLLFSDVSAALKDSIMSSEYLGLRTVDGIKCHQLSFESTGADWQIWIEADSTPVPRRFAVTYVNEESSPEFLARLDQWSLGGQPDVSIFEAAVPEAVAQVPFGP